MTRHKQCPREYSNELQSSLGWPELEGPTIDLLEAIAQHCSINQAAKVVGLSYKSAWEHVETLNNRSDQDLVIRMVGGSGGGGTVLTDAVNDEVTIQLTGGSTVTAIITREGAVGGIKFPTDSGGIKGG